MAKLYVLTEEHIKSGKRPKTPRQKAKAWAKVCVILSALIVIEHLVVLYMWMK